MLLDLSTDLDRIRRHIPCLEEIASNESLSPVQRVAAVVELATWRMAADLAGAEADDA